MGYYPSEEQLQASRLSDAQKELKEAFEIFKQWNADKSRPSVTLSDCILYMSLLQVQKNLVSICNCIDRASGAI